MNALNRYTLRLSILILVCLLPGCLGSLLFKQLQAEINKAFPSVTFEQGKQASLEESAQGLAQLKNPAFLLNVPIETIQESVANAITQIQDSSFHIESVDITSNEQGFDIQTQVSYNVSKPKGQVTLDISGWVPVSVQGNTATIRPMLRNVKLHDLDLYGWGGNIGKDTAKIAVQTLLANIDRYIANINGQIGTISYAMNAADAGLSINPVTVTLDGGRQVTIPGVQLGAMAVLVDSNGLHLMADTSSSTNVEPVGPGNTSFAEYQAAYWDLARAIKPAAENLPGIFVADAFLGALLRPAFPPVDQNEIAGLARTAASTALNSPDKVVAGLSVGSDILVQFVTEQINVALPSIDGFAFGTPNISLADQTITASVPITYTDDGTGLTAKGIVGVAGIVAPLEDKLFVRILATDLTIESLSQRNSTIALQPFVVSISNALAQMIPYLNGIFDAVPITLPAVALSPISLPIDSGLVTTPSEISPADLGRMGLIPRITSQGLQVMLVETMIATNTMTALHAAHELNREEADQQADLGNFKFLASAVPAVDPESLDQTFAAKWVSYLGPLIPLTPHSLGGAGSLSWLTDVVNRTFQRNAVALHGNFTSPPLRADSGSLRFGGGIGVSCSNQRECSRQGCPLRSCSRDSCDWDCRRCAFGFCGDDPICVAGETACNIREESERAACNVQANAEKALCDSSEESKLAACNIQRELEIAGCNVAREAANAINNLGSLGSISVEANAIGTAHIENLGVQYEPNSSTFLLSLRASGQLNTHGWVSYTPAGVGHVLICPIPGQINYTVSGTAPAQDISLTLPISSRNDENDGLVLSVDPGAFWIEGQLYPAPVDALFTHNPQLLVTCSPVLNVPIEIAGLTGKVSAYTPLDVFGAIERAIPDNQEDALEALVMLTSGRMRHMVDLTPINISIPKLPITIGKATLNLRPAFAGNHIQFVNP